MAGSGNTRRRLALLLLVVLCSLASSATVTAPAQASVTVLGAGSTWDQIATTQFAADVHALYGITINYQGVGSSAGREFYIETFPDIGLDRIADDKERCHIVPAPDEAYRFRQSAGNQAIPFDDRPT